MLANYGPEDLEGEMTWKLTEDDTILAQEAFPARSLLRELSQTRGDFHSAV